MPPLHVPVAGNVLRVVASAQVVAGGVVQVTPRHGSGLHAPALHPNWHVVSATMKPQAPAVHAATPLVRNVWPLRHTGAGGDVGHAWHDVPHDATSTSETQRCPHACCPVGHWHWFPLQVPPIGQSADLRQPGVH